MQGVACGKACQLACAGRSILMLLFGGRHFLFRKRKMHLRDSGIDDLGLDECKMMVKYLVICRLKRNIPILLETTREPRTSFAGK